MRSKVALLFPGQGAFYSGALQDTRLVYQVIETTFKTVDEVAMWRFGKSVSEMVWRSKKRSFDEILASAPDVLQLAIYAVSVATFNVLRSEGLRADVLVGHSFGEIAALVCAGCYTVAQGAEIVCDRVLSLEHGADRDGFMVAMQVKAELVGPALALLADPRAVAAVLNHDRQTVIAGPAATMTKLLDVCAAMKWSAIRLNSPYAFHSPLMAAATAEFSKRLKQYPALPPQSPVYSPIFGRYYGAADDPAQFLAEHLLMPVRFKDAIKRLAGEGVDTFVECGALDALSRDFSITPCHSIHS